MHLELFFQLRSAGSVVPLCLSHDVLRLLLYLSCSYWNLPVDLNGWTSTPVAEIQR